MTRRRIAILGGGMSAVTTAYWLTNVTDWQDHFEITIYQQGWRLGGKGASGRGAHDRIEEHGLHVWLGFYDNAFLTLGECYELQGLSMSDAFEPASTFALYERTAEGWLPWLATFPEDGQLPWAQDDPQGPPDLSELVVRCLRLAVTQARALHPERRTAPARSGIRFEPVQPPDPTIRFNQVAGNALGPAVARPGRLRLRERASRVGENLWRRVGDVAGGVADSALEGLLAAAADFADLDEHTPGDDTWLLTALDAAADAAWNLRRLAGDSHAARRQGYLVDLLLAVVRGILADGLLHTGLDLVDDEDFAGWLLRHGAEPDSARCALVTAVVYDLAFAYRDGRPDAPSCSAAAALRGIRRLFFDYKGAVAWKMRGGMGDVVFAPLYAELRDRGVRFEFFHRVDALRLSKDGRHVDAVELTRQASLREGVPAYDPLVRVGALDCWPSAPRFEQLAPEARLSVETPGRFESLTSELPGERDVVLERGRDFDTVVLGIGLGALRHVCADLVDAHGPWRDLVENVKTVATQAFQLWMSRSTEELGDAAPGGTTGAFTEPFDTYADMTHLLPFESWESGVASIAYFCNVLPWPDRPVDAAEQAKADGLVRDNAIRFLEEQLPVLLPGAGHRYPAGFRWELLAGVTERERGPARFDSQFWRANIEPSDRYVLSLPGTARYRMAPGDTGIMNLVVTGDWTDCGLNSGCVEAAVTSGMLAANAVSPELVPRELIVAPEG